MEEMGALVSNHSNGVKEALTQIISDMEERMKLH